VRWCAASIYKAPITSSYRGLNYSDPFGLRVTPLGAQVEAAIKVLMHSATFRRLFKALDSRPIQEVNFVVESATQEAIEKFSSKYGQKNGAGYTHVWPTGEGLSLVSVPEWLQPGSRETLVVHEMIHAAGQYGGAVAGEANASGCGFHDEGANDQRCGALQKTIEDEVRAWREKQAKEEKKP
jgi:hypothetical protein